MTVTFPLGFSARHLRNALAFTLAVTLDSTVKEPPLQVHPVMGIGWVAQQFEAHILQGDHLKAKGMLAWALGAVGMVGLGQLAKRSPWPVRGVILWNMISFGMLIDEVRNVDEALGQGLPQARQQISRLVSRDTSELSESDIASAAIETLSENLVDSVIAPMFWWAWLDMPGVMLYRYCNTLDARWGYLNAYWKDRGWAAANADDLFNYVPARLTGLIMTHRWGTLAKEAAKTPSPNSGWPMGAIALNCNIRLHKPGVYTLNEDARPPLRKDIRKAIPYIARAGIIGLTICMVTKLWRTGR